MRPVMRPVMHPVMHPVTAAAATSTWRAGGRTVDWLLSRHTTYLPMARALLLLCLLPLVATANLFFYLAEAEEICFIDDLALGSTLVVKYIHPDVNSKAVVLKILSPTGKVASTKRAADAGRLAFASAEAGEHKVCISADAQAKAWPAASKTAKISVKLDVVSATVDVADSNLAKQSHVKGLETELNDLASVVDLLLKDMELARQRETHFREQSERINSRVVWWSLLQTAILIAAGVLQSIHLQSFFYSKKIA
jgi:hypothetical protein